MRGSNSPLTTVSAWLLQIISYFAQFQEFGLKKRKKSTAATMNWQKENWKT
jgi:hypothetical protein